MERLILLITCFLTFSSIGNAGLFLTPVTEPEAPTGTSFTHTVHSASNPSALNDIVDESEYVSNYWDCSTQDEKLKHKNLITINEMLQKGEQEMSKRKNQVPNITLVLGDAGVGKTTLVQFMAGDDQKLISKEVGNDTCEYLIEDGVKIGSSVTESSTLFPEMVTNESDGITYCDTPGFTDTRSPNHAILATYLMKSSLKNVTNIKIILMVSHSSVQMGMNKGDFMNLLRNLNNFLKNNVDSYKDNIILIATKVSNSYKVTANQSVTLIPDSNIIISIAEYIDKVKISIEGKIKKIIDKDEKQFLNNSLKILNSITETDEHGNYKKINIFRRPPTSGPLNNIMLLQNNKKSLKATIVNNIDYTELHENNIGYTLSDTAKNHMDCLLNYINDKIINLSKYLFNNLIKRYYKDKIKTYNNIYELSAGLKMFKVELENLKNTLQESKSISNYTDILINFIKNKNITSPNESIFKNYEYEFKQLSDFVYKMDQFTDTSYILKPTTWSSKIEELMNFITDSSKWYDILIKIFENFSTYNVQKSVKKYSDENGFNQINKSNSKEENKSVYRFILSNLAFLSDDEINSYFNNVILDDEQIKELEEVVSVTLKTTTNLVCNNNGKLTASGNFVKISEINTKKIIKDYCGAGNPRIIVIKAVHTVFIDEDLNDDIFKGIDLIILAPKWEIIGSRKIKIDGKDGMHHREITAPYRNTYDLSFTQNLSPFDSTTRRPSYMKPFFPPQPPSDDDEYSDDTENSERYPAVNPTLTTMHPMEMHRINNENSLRNNYNGADGLPGMPGENGGNLMGIGLNFVNGNELKITANGGNGGPGQKGQSGKVGNKGKSGSENIEKVISQDHYTGCSVTTWESGVSSYSTALSKSILNQNFTPAENDYRPSYWSITETGPSNGLFKYMRYSETYTKIDIFSCEGEEGTNGGKGGNGGAGGMGGNPGIIQMIELQEPSNIQLENKTGNVGTPGFGGASGDRGENGLSISCYRVTMRNRHNSYSEIYWRCQENSLFKENSHKKGSDGLPGLSKTGMQLPAKIKGDLNFSPDMLDYVLELQKYRNNKFLSGPTSKFKSEMIKKWFQINNNDLWKLIISQDSTH